jgi:hypothetical protein
MIVAKENKPKNGKIVVDLTGPQGNAFALIGMAETWSKQLGLDPEEVQAQMMSGDYDHLLSVLEKYFGDYIIMYK